MRISDWSSDVCSSDLRSRFGSSGARVGELLPVFADRCACPGRGRRLVWIGSAGGRKGETHDDTDISCRRSCARSEEHTSELQSLMRISYAVFCLKKKKTKSTYKKNQ